MLLYVCLIFVLELLHADDWSRVCAHLRVQCQTGFFHRASPSDLDISEVCIEEEFFSSLSLLCVDLLWVWLHRWCVLHDAIPSLGAHLRSQMDSLCRVLLVCAFVCDLACTCFTAYYRCILVYIGSHALTFPRHSTHSDTNLLPIHGVLLKLVWNQTTWWSFFGPNSI